MPIVFEGTDIWLYPVSESFCCRIFICLYNVLFLAKHLLTDFKRLGSVMKKNQANCVTGEYIAQANLFEEWTNKKRI